jgi:hypothetical protein
MEDGIGGGRDVLDRCMPFDNGAVLNPVGMINVADSLAAVKRLVYDERRCSLAELRAALDADWVGHDDLRRLCLAAPKFGNGDAFVDRIAADLYRFWVDTAETFPTVFGSTHKATAISITSHQPGGALTGATPDGRRAHEILADGTLSPMQGADTHGPTRILASAMAVDQGPVPGHAAEHEAAPVGAAQRRRPAQAGRADAHLFGCRRQACAVQRGRPRPRWSTRSCILSDTVTWRCAWPATAPTSCSSAARCRTR